MIDDALLSKYDIHDAEELRATLRDGTRIRQGFKVPETTYEGEERDDY